MYWVLSCAVALMSLILVVLLGCSPLRPGHSETSARIAPVRSVAFWGRDNAWLVTGMGQLLVTRNGGTTWATVTEPVVRRFQRLAFVDELTGWAVNDRGEVWRSTDSGSHWAKISKVPYSREPHGLGVQKLGFVSAVEGWASDSLSMWRTYDGGVTWMRYFVAPRERLELLRDGRLISAGTGWIIDQKGRVYSTADGGRTWLPLQKATQINAYSLFFLDDKNCWALGAPGPDPDRTSLYNSDDGGRTWQVQYDFGEDEGITSCYFLDTREGWIVGSRRGLPKTHGMARHTTDGGTTWEYLSPKDESHWYKQVYFHDRDSGWLLAPNKLYRTTDRGATWRCVLTVPLEVGQKTFRD